MCNSHNPILCVIPPYMLDKALERGGENVRNAVAQLIKQSNHFRAQRTLIQERPQPIRQAMASGVDPHSFEMTLRVFDAKQGDTLPGTIVRTNKTPATGDKAVDDAFDGAKATWELYNQQYGRNSIDDGGMVIEQTVHFGYRFNNAFWNGEQMVYGDGDGELFNSFTSDIDIMAHELTHGVTQYEAGLVYYYQSGALNESFSDVFGSLVKQRSRGQEAKDADWLIGENVLVGDQFALRSMKAPGTAYRNHPILGDDPQPATMDTYLTLPPWDDNGGVHLNSGIPNYAFYLAAIELGGKAWEKAGLIWYRALTNKLNRVATFPKAARATIQAAREEFGVGSLEEKAVTNAWKTVKVI